MAMVVLLSHAIKASEEPDITPPLFSTPTTFTLLISVDKYAQQIGLRHLTSPRSDGNTLNFT